MNAKTQFKLSASDLETILAMVRTGTLVDAGERLGVDSSTVFRSIRRIERGLQQRLFERSRSGYAPSALARALAEHAAQLEAQLEAARSAAQLKPEQLSGTVRITTTDTLLHGLVAPVLKPLQAAHPLLMYELNTSNARVSLSKRDADIAVRATRGPPPDLVGKHIGTLQAALFAAKKGPVRRYEEVVAGKIPWVAPDDALPDHPSVRWRRQNFPKVLPGYRVNSILTVMEFVVLGLGVGVLPLFLARSRNDLIALTDPIEDCRTELWLLTYPESRHMKTVTAVFKHLSDHLRL
jgi:DNA-binding transcriptional LysR family regulator